MGELDTADRLLEKSKEAFALAVELYNRPTLKYHAESCSIFLCNAWELMLKSYIIRKYGIDEIYYDDGDKTIALTDCLKKVFTNDKDPLRINMAELIRFRNTNTHFITDEYEIFYGPFLQMSVNNYADKLFELHGQSVSDLIPENHLTLAVKRGAIEPEVIRAKYEPHVAKKLLSLSKQAVDAAGDGNSGRVAAIYETNFRLVKKARDADLNVYVSADAEDGITIVKDIRDSSSYYPFTANGCIEEVNKRLKKAKVQIQFRDSKKNKFTSHDFQLFIKAYAMKGDPRFSHDRKASNEVNPSWTYSQQAIKHIADELIKDPEKCLDRLKFAVSKKNN